MGKIVNWNGMMPHMASTGLSYTHSDDAALTPMIPVAHLARRGVQLSHGRVSGATARIAADGVTVNARSQNSVNADWQNVYFSDSDAYLRCSVSMERLAECYVKDFDGNVLWSGAELVFSTGGTRAMVGNMLDLRMRLLMAGGERFAVTRKRNPELMAAVYAAGWAASEEHMTFAEAAAVTDMEQHLRNKGIRSLNELRHFTSLTEIKELADNPLMEVAFPPSAKTIKGYTFASCPFERFVVPEGIKEGLGFFRNAYLEEVEWNSTQLLPANYYIGGYDRFARFKRLTSRNPAYKSVNGCLWSADGKTLYCVPSGIDSGFEFLGTEELIYGNVFKFYGTGTETVRLPATVKTITPIWRGMMEDCNIKELDLSAVTYTESLPCLARGCTIGIVRMLRWQKSGYGILNGTTIGSLIIGQEEPPTLNGQLAEKEVGAIYVPDSALDAYKADTNWNKWYGDKLKPMSEYSGE